MMGKGLQCAEPPCLAMKEPGHRYCKKHLALADGPGPSTEAAIPSPTKKPGQTASRRVVSSAATLPRSKVVPPINDLLADAQVVAGHELARLKSMAAKGLSDGQVRRLEALVRALKNAQELEEILERKLDPEDMTDEELEEALLEERGIARTPEAKGKEP